MPSHLSLKSGCTDLLKASRGTGGCTHSRPNSQVTAVCVVPHSMLHLLPQLFVEQLRGTVLPLSGGLNEKHSPRGSYAWTLGPQLALLLGRVLELLEGAASLEEKCWMPALRVWNPGPLPILPLPLFLSLLPVCRWNVSSQLPAPATTPYLPRWTQSFWNRNQMNSSSLAYFWHTVLS